MRNFLVLLCLLVLSGCYSSNSIRVAEWSDIARERERGFVNINPVRMSEVSGEDILLNLDTLLKDEKALEYFEKYKQENRTSYRQKSTGVTVSVGKPLGDDAESTKAADFDSDKFENNDTAISYYDLIEMAANSQMLARSLIRRFSKIKSPSSEHKLYCIPVDITFFPGTITQENYRADVMLRFRKKSDENNRKADKDLKIFAIAPYEYSKISSIMQAQLRELFITVAAKGTIKGASVEGRFDKVIRNFNKLQRTLSRPEITATLIEDDTILFTYWGYADLDGSSHLMSGETFRCELFVYYKPELELGQYCNSENSAKNVNLKDMVYDYMWQYTPTKDFRWFNPINWFFWRDYPSELNTMLMDITTNKEAAAETTKKAAAGTNELCIGDWGNYRYGKRNQPLWVDNLILICNLKTSNIYYLRLNDGGYNETKTEIYR